VALNTGVDKKFVLSRIEMVEHRHIIAMED